MICSSERWCTWQEKFTVLFLPHIPRSSCMMQWFYQSTKVILRQFFTWKYGMFSSFPYSKGLTPQAILAMGGTVSRTSPSPPPIICRSRLKSSGSEVVQNTVYPMEKLSTAKICSHLSLSSEKWRLGGWRDDSAMMSTCCFCREPRQFPAHARWLTEDGNSTSRRSAILFRLPSEIYPVYNYTCRHS